jgi:Hint domain
MSTLSFTGVPVTPVAYDDTTPAWINPFGAVGIDSSSPAATHSFFSITIGGIPAGTAVRFSNGTNSFTVAGFTFSVALSGGTATITKTSGNGTAPRGDWASAIDAFQIEATSAFSIANGNHTLTLGGTPTFGDTVTPSTETLDVTCFYAGTLIATPAGGTAVETLKPGDLVLTADGVAAPVRWLGRQSVSTVFGDKLSVLPIRIKAGALADNVPARDLLVSPEHALLVEGVLIQAGALVNGTSIVRETAVPSVIDYYHVELDAHALLLAEGAPAESFVDNVGRFRFDNWSEHEALYPDGKSVAEMAYPRAKSHRQVPDHIRQALADRALDIAPAASAVA